MSEIKVNRRTWRGSVPEHLLTDSRLSHAAVRLGAWLAIRPDGWLVRKTHARRVLQLGETSWDRACKELKTAGYMSTTSIRVGGTFAGTNYIFYSDGSPEVVSPPTEKTGNGDPVPGEPAQLIGTGLICSNEKSSSIKTTTTTCTSKNYLDLVWPDVVVVEQRSAVSKEFDSLSTIQQQELLDELAGQPAGKVHNPAGWLRSMVELAKSGHFVAELAHAVRNARETARMQHQARLDAVTLPLAPANDFEKAASAALRVKSLERLRQLRSAFFKG